MASDEMRAQYPGIFAAVRLTAIPVERDLVRYLVHWLGDYIRLKQQPGQPGVPEGVVAAQHALADACIPGHDSRQHESERSAAVEILLSGHDVRVGTAEAAAELGISPDAVRWHCRHGNLDAKRVGRQLMVTTSSILNYKQRRNESRSA